LLHLASQPPSRERYAVPKEFTQTGIAGVLGVRTGHISREMQKLAGEGLVEERDSAVEGAKRHQKAYFLLPSGLQAATHLAAELGPEAAKAAVGIAPAATPVSGGAVRLDQGLPRPRYFFGRTKELESARESLDERAVVVVVGIAGIGKSTFGARLFEEASRERSVVWHAVREYDNATAILEPAASLLAALGRPRLQLLLKREGPLDLARAREVVIQDVKGLRLAAFVDDVHAAGPEALMAVRVLREAACEQPDAFKLILLSRVRPPVYDAREVALRRQVAEFDLTGLDREGVTALLQVAKRDGSTDFVYEMTAGHPLFVELVRDSERAAVGGRTDPRHIDRFLHDEIFSKLSPGELALLPRVVFVRRPVDPRVVLSPPATLKDLIDLENRSLLRRDERGRVSMHDAVRDFVRRTLPQEESRRQSASVLGALLDEAGRAAKDHDAEYRIDLLESALDLVTEEAGRGSILVGLADAHFDLMQYGAALVRGREALQIARASKVRTAVLAALVQLADIHIEAAHAEASLDFLREADELAALEPAPPPALQGRLFLTRARWLDAFGSPSAAKDWALRALPLARETGDLDTEARIELVFSHTTPAPEAHEHIAKCLDLAARAGDLALVSFAHAVAAWHYVHFSGDLGRALAHASEGLKVGESIQNRALANWSIVSVAKVQWRAGDFAAALETARTAMAGGDRLVSYQLYPLYLISLAETDSGDPVAGERIARELVRLAEEFDWSWAGTAPLRALSNALEAQGREEEALPLLETAHAFAVKTARPCDMGGDAIIVERLIELDAKGDNQAAALRWAESLEHICTFLDGPVVEAFSSMGRGHLLAKSDPAAAALLYGAASQRWKEVGWRPFELRMVKAALDHGRRARGSGGAWPKGLEGEAALERREEEIEASLAGRRPTSTATSS
jgi:tetratricopeptide (TPR) repeat protein/DNA-binding MarR family transcriptional regulator